VISALLVALVVRALIPAGFMPAADRPFSFQICPDGFPAALLAQEPGAPAPAGPDALATAPPIKAAATPVGHHHHVGGPLSHARHYDGAGATGHAQHHHDIDGMLAGAHHHDSSRHDHNSARAEHCVFAAAAGAFALAFAPTFSAPATTLAAPEAAYLAPAFESLRFRLPQPRGPPALS
jgi:hypothetical protein